MCVHYEILNSPAPGEHLIGVCRYCGRRKDYTILQKNDPGVSWICLADTWTRPDIDMSRIMATKKPGGEMIGYSRGRVR